MSSNIHSASHEIMTRAIQRAIDNGWSFALLWAAIEPDWKWEILDGDESIQIDAPDKTIWQGANPYWTIDWYRLIFNHDFAKALWGEAEHTAEIPSDDYDARDCDNCHGSWINKPYSCWEYRLQQMVIADDPIKYLGDNI